MRGAARPLGTPSVAASLLVLQVGAWFAMLGPHRDWLGSWRMAIDWASGSVVICGPLLAGLVATAYATWRQTSAPDLVRSSARRLRGWSALAVRVWVLGVANLLIVAAAVTLRTIVIGGPIAPRQLVILIPSTVMLAVHTLVGMAVGLRVGTRTAGALAATLSFGLFLLATRHLAPPSFITGGVSGPMIGEQYELSAVASLVGFALLSALAVLPWVVPSEGPGLRRGAITGICVAGLLGLSQLTWPDLEGRTETAVVHYECQGHGPRVCVADDAVHLLDQAARRMHRLAVPLLGAGVRLPDRWEQSIPGQAHNGGAGSLDVSAEAEFGDQVADEYLTASLTTPSDCSQYYDNTEQTRSWEARNLLRRWIAFRNGLGSTRHSAPWFSSEASKLWVRATYEQLRSCELDRVHGP